MKKYTALLSLLLALAIAVFVGCSSENTPTPPGTPTTFQYEVPDYIESAWLITHDEQGNLISSTALSGKGEVTLNAKERGLVTLAVEDTWSENGAQKRAFHLGSYPTSVASTKILTFSHWPWLKPNDFKLVTIRATCPQGATRIVVRGSLAAWSKTCESDTNEYEFFVRADALAHRSDGKLGAVLFAFDSNSQLIQVAVIEAFNPDEVPTIKKEDWSSDFEYSELHVTYPNQEEAQKHSIGTTIFANASGGWYDVDRPGAETAGNGSKTIVHHEPYASLSAANRSIMWYWSMKTIQPDVEGATSILARKEVGIPERVDLSFDTDFAPYPEYIEWADKDGRIWVRTQVEAPSTPTYYYAVVRSNSDNTEKEWSIVLFGDHRNGAVFPELPSNLSSWKPSKVGADQALVSNDVGAIRWLTVQEDPEGSLGGSSSWYVWRWKYVVGSSQTQALNLSQHAPFFARRSQP